MNTPCSHKIVMQFSGNTKCFLCKSFVVFNKEKQLHEVIHNPK